VLVDISQWYDLTRTGKHLVTLEIRWEGQSYRSAKSVLEVVEGIPVDSVTEALSGHPDEVRTYMLRDWARNRAEYLFLIVDGPDNFNYGVQCLGRCLRTLKPVLRMDKGRLVAVPAGWTDAVPVDPATVVSAGRSPFRLQDLLELARLVEALGQEASNER
jgi:hypothetical protein